MDIVMGDIYWGISMPTQGLLMLYGLPPTNTYETVKEFKEDEGKIIVQDVLKPKVIYESSDFKAKTLIPLFLVFIFAILHLKIRNYSA